jgi:hypothetical protein
MHLVEIEFIGRRHSDQQREMGCNEYDECDNGTSHRRMIGNRRGFKHDFHGLMAMRIDCGRSGF